MHRGKKQEEETPLEDEEVLVERFIMWFMTEEGGCGGIPAVHVHLDRSKNLWSPLAPPPQTEAESVWSAAAWDLVWLQVYIEAQRANK